MIRSQVSCIPVKKGKIAVIRKNNTSSSTHQMWIPAGGHVEHGETLEEACVREIKEETGLSINDPRFRGIVTLLSDNGYHSIFSFFIDENPEGKIEITEENIDVEWIEIDEIIDREDVTFYHQYIYKKMLIDQDFFNIIIQFSNIEREPQLIENAL